MLKKMQVDSRVAESIRSAVVQRKLLPDGIHHPSGFTLPGLFDAVATAAAYASMPPIPCLVADWQNTQDSSFAEAWEIWRKGNPSIEVDIHGTRLYEFYSLRSADDQTGTAFQLFQERFVRSLKQSGAEIRLAYAFVGAFAEMTDNVVQHSADISGSFQGLAGYHVGADHFAFSVIDIGRGILSSLRSSAAWGHLASHEEALFAAVCDNASRRSNSQHGDGFKTLFRSMTDRNCRLRFRSGDALLILQDSGQHREATHRSSPALQGFQMSAICSKAGDATEKGI